MSTQLPRPEARSVGLPAVGSVIRRVAFWTAVLLPFSYVALLTGPVTDHELTILTGLFALNVACLLVGHGHLQEP